MQHKQIISLLVHNHPGVLLRITGLFTRRGFNIDSLTVSETQDSQYSRMTIVIKGDDVLANQVICQVMKVADVKKSYIIPEEEATRCELMLIKVIAEPSERACIFKIAATYHATVVNVGQHSITIQATALPEELDEMIMHLKKQGILELVRTGLTALQIGDACITDQEESNQLPSAEDQNFEP